MAFGQGWGFGRSCSVHDPGSSAGYGQGRSRGRLTVRVTKVKGHATDADVDQGRVRLEDRLGNAEADAAADLGGRHQCELVMDAWRGLLKVRARWCPIMQQLHRLMIAVSRVAVNHDGKGSSALTHLFGIMGQRGRCEGLILGLKVDLASLPGPRGFLNGPWMQVHGGCITGADVVARPYSVGLLCKFTAFLGTLHWPADAVDMGHFGVSFLKKKKTYPFRAVGWSQVAQ